MVLKTHLEPFREPLKVPLVGQKKKPFFLRVYNNIIGGYTFNGYYMNLKERKRVAVRNLLGFLARIPPHPPATRIVYADMTIQVTLS